jgi:hypothetical protein
MFDKSRREEKLGRSEILAKIRPGDLIAISGGDGIVHIVFPGTGTICRGKMLEVGTYSRDERTWDILGTTDFQSYKKTVVDELKMKPCGHCLSWYR